MKPNYILQILILTLFVFSANAQQGINYKAIINDSNGSVLANTLIVIQFTILENGTEEVYKEMHSPTTDAHGIITVSIGEGTLINGDFDSIYWGNNPHFLKTEINTGGGLTDMGTTEFQAVPYALYAKDGAGAKKLNDLSDVIDDSSSIFIGRLAGNSDDGSNSNIALGHTALYHNTEGSENTAIGGAALNRNTIGSNNTASGWSALFHNTEGNSNTASGDGTLFNNNSGGHNTANGIAALYSNTSGSYNVATGRGSLFFNTTGYNNTANGNLSLFSLIGGDNNTAMGNNALYDLTVGTNNIGLGYDAQVPNSSGSNQVRIGNEDITYAGIQVAWTVTSDERWKEDIRSLPYGLDMLMKLKPVDYVRKNNNKPTREMGIIAQDLEEVLNDMGYNDQGFLIKDDDGLLHLRYNDLIALLTKAIQDQQAIIHNQEEKLDLQEARINNLNSEVEQLGALQDRIKMIEEKLETNEL